MLVYLCGPITGLSYEGATDWRGKFRQFVSPAITLLSPMRGKDYLVKETSIAHSYEDIPLSSARGIITRDYFDCKRCDLLVANLLGAKTVSIGSVMEIAWAKAFQIPVVVIMEKNGNLHDHPMINESTGFRVESLEAAAHVVNVLLLPGDQ